MTKVQIGEVIKNARLASGLTQSEVAKLLNRPQQTIANWEVGRSQPDANTLFELFHIFNVDINEAFGFKTESPLTDEDWKIAHDYHKLDQWGKRVVQSVITDELARIEAESLATQPAPDPEPEENIIRFPMPFYLQPSSAGFGDWADSEYAEKVMLVKEPPFGAAFIIPVNGNSMEPTYPDGCKVFVRPQHEVREGQVGIFYMDGKLWIKQLGDGELISINEAYPPQPFQEDLRCWGLVVGICDDSYFEH